MSLDQKYEKEYEKALDAARKKSRARAAKAAITRYGYLIARWPIIEDDLDQSGGGAVLIGHESDLTISRGDHPKSKAALQGNFERLREDVKKILGARFTVVTKNDNIFIKPSQ